MTEQVKTGLIIIGIYLLFLLYLFAASDRFEKLDNNNSSDSNVVLSYLNN